MLSDFWTSTTQIRTQLKFLAIKYPLKLETVLSQDKRASNGFKAIASILLHKLKAKALVAFVFDEAVLAAWPFAIQQIECEVQIAYGKVKSVISLRLYINIY